MLPEVVYAYGLRESIWNGYLKDADPIAFENVKDTEFLRMAVTTFWERYGGKTYEGLNPKLAIYASRVEEAVNEVRPALEEILADLGIPASSILVNVGETKYTKDEDIRNFNDLDVQGSQGNEKQFIILVDKGKEGWNCRSLFGVARSTCVVVASHNGCSLGKHIDGVSKTGLIRSFLTNLFLKVSTKEVMSFIYVHTKLW